MAPDFHRKAVQLNAGSRRFKRLSGSHWQVCACLQTLTRQNSVINTNCDFDQFVTDEVKVALRNASRDSVPSMKENAPKIAFVTQSCGQTYGGRESDSPSHVSTWTSVDYATKIIMFSLTTLCSVPRVPFSRVSYHTINAQHPQCVIHSLPVT